MTEHKFRTWEGAEEYAANMERRVEVKEKELREQDAKLEYYRKEIAKLQYRVEDVLRAFDAALIYDVEERQAWDRFYASVMNSAHSAEFSAREADRMLKERRERFGSPLAQRVKRPE